MTKSAKTLAKYKVKKVVEKKPKKVVTDEQREADRQRNMERLSLDRKRNINYKHPLSAEDQGTQIMMAQRGYKKHK